MSPITDITGLLQAYHSLTMPTPPPSEIQAQFAHLRSTGLDTLLATHATANGFPRSFLFAIASRETNCQNILGDIENDQAHGVGIIQIDVQHPIAQQARDSGSWKTNPEPLIDFGAKLLAANLVQVKHILVDLRSPTDKFVNNGPNDLLRVTASGYNCGVSRAITAARTGGDCDPFTTGKDYGRDVIARMALFEALLAPPATHAVAVPLNSAPPLPA